MNVISCAETNFGKVFTGFADVEFFACCKADKEIEVEIVVEQETAEEPAAEEVVVEEEAPAAPAAEEPAAEEEPVAEEADFAE